MKSGQRRGGRSWRRKAKARSRRDEERLKGADAGPLRIFYVDRRELRRGQVVDLEQLRRRAAG